MIGWLSGKVRELDPIGMVLMDVQGVGYDVSVSLQTLCNLKVGDATSLSIHTYVREDQLVLFGFKDVNERETFRKLNKVTGIGAKMALNLMSGMSTSDFVSAIEQADDIAIARTPGIGKKTIQRLILELQGKITFESAEHASNPALQDIKSALLNLGYKAVQIDKVIQTLDTSQNFETCFKTALKSLA